MHSCPTMKIDSSSVLMAAAAAAAAAMQPTTSTSFGDMVSGAAVTRRISTVVGPNKPQHPSRPACCDPPTTLPCCQLLMQRSLCDIADVTSPLMNRTVPLTPQATLCSTSGNNDSINLLAPSIECNRIQIGSCPGSCSSSNTTTENSSVASPLPCNDIRQEVVARLQRYLEIPEWIYSTSSPLSASPPVSEYHPPSTATAFSWNPLPTDKLNIPSLRHNSSSTGMSVTSSSSSSSSLETLCVLHAPILPVSQEGRLELQNADPTSPTSHVLLRFKEPQCNHFSHWKRLRAKKGYVYHVCQLCGLKWRVPTKTRLLVESQEKA